MEKTTVSIEKSWTHDGAYDVLTGNTGGMRWTVFTGTKDEAEVIKKAYIEVGFEDGDKPKKL